MNNAVAVYTSKASLKGRELADMAQAHGVTLRYLALGVYICRDPAEIQNTALTTVRGGALLVVGAFESDDGALAKLDALLKQGDRKPIVEMLQDAKLPWCELYTSRFNYEQMVKAKPKDKSKIDGSVQTSQLPTLKAARTRYVIYNQSRKKNGGQLMTRLAEVLASGTEGIIADYQRPSR